MSGADLMLLRAGLRVYLHAFEAHAAEDAHLTHDSDQVSSVRRTVGQLLWRLEEAGATQGARLQHSQDAVEPDG